jgi:hypothetical protein
VERVAVANLPRGRDFVKPLSIRRSWPGCFTVRVAMSVSKKSWSAPRAGCRVAAHEVRAKCEGLRLGLADAVGVVLADCYRTDRIFTLDQRGFRGVGGLTAG